MSDAPVRPARPPPEAPVRPRAAPRVVVWELTLACDARCRHCGSDAGRPRARELDAAEALALCDALAELGVAQVTLSGGEPLLRHDWAAIAARLVGAGIEVDIISNGLALDASAARRVAELGVHSVSLSLDGPAAVHDALRGVPGAHARTLAAAAALRAAGIPVGAVTQVGRTNLGRLAELEDELVRHGFAGWQVQLTMPVGRAAPCGLALAPTDVPAVIAFVAGAAARGRLPVAAADDLGWMTRDEPRLRAGARPHAEARSRAQFYPGCQAGLTVLGITSDGTVRGCLAMPPALDEGSVRDRPLAELWDDERRFAYNRRPRGAGLTGPCAACPYGRVCRAGCKALAYAATGALGENPYCARLQGPRPDGRAP